MNENMDFDRLVADWLKTDGPGDVRPGVVGTALSTARIARQRRGFALALVGPAPWPAYGRRVGFGTLPPAIRIAVVLALALPALVAAVYVGSQLLRLIQPRAAHTIVITTEAGTSCPAPGGGTSTGYEARAIDLDTRTARALAVVCGPLLLLSPDAIHAAVWDDVNGPLLVRVDLGTGTKTTIAEVGDFERDTEPVMWSPKGTYLYWRGQRAVPNRPSLGHPQFDSGAFVSRADGGTTERLPLASPDLGTPGELIWTPDETRVAFNDLDGRWWLGSGDGTAFRQLTALGSRWLAMSPDGLSFAMAKDRTDEAGAVVATDVLVGDGFSPPNPITGLADGGIAHAAVWLPDRSALAVVVTRPRAETSLPTARITELELLAPTGVNVLKRFELPAIGEASDRPSYAIMASPDGRYVAISRGTVTRDAQGLETHRTWLAIVRLSDGVILPSPSQRLAEFTDPNGWTKVTLSDLVFSPDGSRAVLHIYGGFQVIDLDGTGSSRLGFDDVAPHGWGNQLVWTP